MSPLFLWIPTVVNILCLLGYVFFWRIRSNTELRQLRRRLEVVERDGDNLRMFLLRAAEQRQREREESASPPDPFMASVQLLHTLTQDPPTTLSRPTSFEHILKDDENSV